MMLIILVHYSCTLSFHFENFRDVFLILILKYVLSTCSVLLIQFSFFRYLSYAYIDCPCFIFLVILTSYFFSVFPTLFLMSVLQKSVPCNAPSLISSIDSSSLRKTIANSQARYSIYFMTGCFGQTLVGFEESPSLFIFALNF